MERHSGIVRVFANVHRFPIRLIPEHRILANLFYARVVTRILDCLSGMKDEPRLSWKYDIRENLMAFNTKFNTIKGLQLGSGFLAYATMSSSQ
jgi:hypothetical protein